MKLDDYARFDKLVTAASRQNETITETIREISVEISQLRKERDEWRKVADELAAHLDDTDSMCVHTGITYSALAKFKELEKKYPL